jgi:flagellar hook assembly protein FlgD
MWSVAATYNYYSGPAIGQNGILVFSGGGSNITAYNTSLIGQKGNEEEIPINFSLSQNYPNPFNPVTIIKFGLSKTSYVTLKIYDLTGRLVTTLINEEKEAGFYEVQFNGSNLSSGIYFYEIDAGEYKTSKKCYL